MEHDGNAMDYGVAPEVQRKYDGHVNGHAVGPDMPLEPTTNNRGTCNGIANGCGENNTGTADAIQTQHKNEKQHGSALGIQKPNDHRGESNQSDLNKRKMRLPIAQIRSNTDTKPPMQHHKIIGNANYKLAST